MSASVRRRVARLEMFGGGSYYGPTPTLILVRGGLPVDGPQADVVGGPHLTAYPDEDLEDFKWRACDLARRLCLSRVVIRGLPRAEADGMTFDNPIFRR